MSAEIDKKSLEFKDLKRKTFHGLVVLKLTKEILEFKYLQRKNFSWCMNDGIDIKCF